MRKSSFVADRPRGGVRTRRASRWVAVVVLGVGSAALAGISLPPGRTYTTTPAGTFETGTLILDPWTDGLYYYWVPDPPPSDNGHYQNNGPPVKTVTFTGGPDSGTYTGSTGSGTYTKK